MVSQHQLTGIGICEIGPFSILVFDLVLWYSSILVFEYIVTVIFIDLWKCLKSFLSVGALVCLSALYFLKWSQYAGGIIFNNFALRFKSRSIVRTVKVRQRFYFIFYLLDSPRVLLGWATSTMLQGKDPDEPRQRCYKVKILRSHVNDAIR